MTPLTMPISVNWQLLLKAIVGFNVGALIGLEREKAKIMAFKKDESGLQRPSYLGVRTFSFLSLLGTLTAIAPNLAPQFMVVPLSIFLVLTPATIIILVTLHKLFEA